jgi:hypothetical protein
MLLKNSPYSKGIKMSNHLLSQIRRLQSRPYRLKNMQTLRPKVLRTKRNLKDLNLQLSKMPSPSLPFLKKFQSPRQLRPATRHRLRTMIRLKTQMLEK